MARRLPPRGFGASKLELEPIRTGTKWYRLYSARYPEPLGFGFSPSRFSGPRVALPEKDRFGIIYFGSSIKVCFLRIARESLNAALLANPENIADIQTEATNLANALSTSSVQMALHRAKINAVLTPAQRVALFDAGRRPMRGWNRPRGGAERGPWQERRPWQRQDQLPKQKPAPQDSRTPAAPDSED